MWSGGIHRRSAILQLPEGEVPTEGVQEDTMSMGGDVSVGEAMLDSGEVPDSGAPSGDGDAAFPDAEPPLTDDSVGEGFSSEEPSPGGIPQEDAADDSQYKDEGIYPLMAGYRPEELYILWRDNFRGQHDEVRVMMDFALCNRATAKALIAEFENRHAKELL